MVEEAKGRQMHRYEVANLKRKNFLKDSKSILSQVKSNLENAERCFSILFPGFSDEYNDVPGDEPKAKRLKLDNSSSSTGSSSQVPGDLVEWEDDVTDDDNALSGSRVSSLTPTGRLHDFIALAGIGSESYSIVIFYIMILHLAAISN